MLTKAKLFVIICGINQASHLPNTKRIVVISDSIHMAKNFFDSSVHSYQIYSAAISYKLRKLIVDKETKKFNLILIPLCKYFWDFSRKNKCDNILNVWKMHFQASDDKGQHFLKLCDNNIQPITLSIAKGGLWLKYFGYSNLLCIRASRAIVNHVPMDRYQLRFFPREKFDCPCDSYSIESRQYILYDYKRYNNYWNLRWD